MFKSAMIIVVMKPVTTAGQISPDPMSYTKTILKTSFHTWEEGRDTNCLWQTGVSQHILKERAAAWHIKKALHGSVMGTVILCQLQLFSGLYKCWSWKYIMRGKSVNSFLCLVLDITWTCVGYFFTPSSTDVCLYLHTLQDMKRSQIPKGKRSWLPTSEIFLQWIQLSFLLVKACCISLCHTSAVHRC